MKKKLRIRWSVEMMCKGGFRLRFLTLTVPEDGLPLDYGTIKFPFRFALAKPNGV